LKHDKITPYQSGENKTGQVAEMFDNISPQYDRLNHLFSLGIDIRWRNKAIDVFKSSPPDHLLDVATGTADFAIQTARRLKGVNMITGIDISQGMLDVGRKKITNKELDQRIQLICADSQNLPFSDDTFDACTVGFGVRNFENLESGLREIRRVLKPGSKLVVLEFSKPSGFPMKQLFRLYFHHIMPVIGKIVSKDHRAYTYLPESVDHFPAGQEFIDVMRNCGFGEISEKRLSGGIATIYTGVK
jgi:demethylmenaquinone methyltransferase/2-methoxy-6-polyprenyl-1,4-benzoquinol methylase